ncbi:MAG: transposase family protein [Mariprofundaceae bacterium]|nr:transposase family protein [Mariprofundaceae bacterium]
MSSQYRVLNAWIASLFDRSKYVLQMALHSTRFRKLVLVLSRPMTIKAVASYLGVSWGFVKDIQKDYLYRRYKTPKLNKLKPAFRSLKTTF